MSSADKDLKVHASHQDEKLLLELLVDQEQMKLFMKLKKLSSSSITELEVLQILSNYIDSNLVDHDVIKEAIKSANNTHEKEPLPRRIAKGTLAVSGVDGKILLLAKALDYKKTHSDNDDDAGIFELHLFDNIEVGRIVGRVYPPKAGTDGKDVFGKIIPALPGKAVNVELDQTITTETAENYTILKAKVCGYLEKKGNALSIKEELIFKNDIDYRTGNIDFINKVIVNKDVGSGFRVRGQKGILVKGSVQAGSIIQGGTGTAEVNGFAISTLIEAFGDVTVNNVQECKIESQKWITIKKQSADCITRAVEGVEAETAHVFGGEIYCVLGANIGTLGNSAGSTTKVFLSTKSSVTSAFSDITNKISSHQEILKIMEAHLGPYALNPIRIDRLLEPHRSKMKDLYKKLEVVKSSLATLTAELKKLNQEVVPEESRITVKKMIYNGAQIYCTIEGEQKSLVFHESIKGPKTIKQVEKELKIVDVSPIIKPNEKNQNKSGVKK